MEERDKKKKGPDNPKTNVSVNYYIYPVYSASGAYGFENDNSSDYEPVDDPKKSAIDEPVESWGWINNVD